MGLQLSRGAVCTRPEFRLQSFQVPSVVAPSSATCGRRLATKLLDPFGCNPLKNQMHSVEIKLRDSLPYLSNPVSLYLTLSFWCSNP